MHAPAVAQSQDRLASAQKSLSNLALFLVSFPCHLDCTAVAYFVHPGKIQLVGHPGCKVNISGNEATDHRFFTLLPIKTFGEKVWCRWGERYLLGVRLSFKIQRAKQEAPLGDLRG